MHNAGRSLPLRFLKTETVTGASQLIKSVLGRELIKRHKRRSFVSPPGQNRTFNSTFVTQGLSNDFSIIGKSLLIDFDPALASKYRNRNAIRRRTELILMDSNIRRPIPRAFASPLFGVDSLGRPQLLYGGPPKHHSRASITGGPIQWQSRRGHPLILVPPRYPSSKLRLRKSGPSLRMTGRMTDLDTLPVDRYPPTG